MNNQLTIAIPKGRILTESIELFAKIGIHLESMLEDSRKLIFEYPEQNLRAFGLLITRAGCMGCLRRGSLGAVALAGLSIGRRKRPSRGCAYF